MKEGEVDTKEELEKFQLFERINSVSIKSKEIRILMSEHVEKMKKDNYDQLVKLLKEISYAGKLMHLSVKGFYDNYTIALERADELIAISNKIIGKLISFRYYDQDGDGILDYSFEEPEVLIGNSLRSSLQDMINVGEKIIHMVNTFSVNHGEEPEVIMCATEEESEKEESSEVVDDKSIKEEND